jgi:hypothetical protein
MTICNECGYAKDTWKEEGALENGLRFNSKEMGYYGGFTDSNPWEEAQDQDVVLLCHDCSLRLMRAFPSVARAMGANAGHPCDKEKACCEFAWKFDEDLRVLRGTRVGTWELRGGQ